MLLSLNVGRSNLSGREKECWEESGGGFDSRREVHSKMSGRVFEKLAWAKMISSSCL